MQFSCMYDFDADGEKDVLKVYRNYKINEIFYFPYLKVDFGYQNIKAKTKNKKHNYIISAYTSKIPVNDAKKLDNY